MTTDRAQDAAARPNRPDHGRQAASDADGDWQALAEPIRESIQLAWQSFRAGNLGIGSVITDAGGQILARGRNCLINSTPGERDPLVDTSIAHAEMNALAQIPFTEIYEGGLTLYTTLQPCLQCLGAITLSAVQRVEALAPDPLYRGLEKIRDIVYFNRSKWPVIRQQPITRWTVLTLLLRTYQGISTRFGATGWDAALPSLAAMSHTLHECGLMANLVATQPAVIDAARQLWTSLGDGLDDVRNVAAATGELRAPSGAAPPFPDR